MEDIGMVVNVGLHFYLDETDAGPTNYQSGEQVKYCEALPNLN